MAGYWPSSFFACLWTETKSYPAILTEQAWSIKDLLYGIKHQSTIFVLVYSQGLKRKPVVCKNQWRVLLFPNWLNGEIQSFDWFTFLTSKCLTSEWSKRMYETAQSKFEKVFEPQKCLEMA